MIEGYINNITDDSLNRKFWIINVELQTRMATPVNKLYGPLVISKYAL